MLKARSFILPAALYLGISFASAAKPDVTLTYTMTGTMGPLISGSDPAGANGHMLTVTIVASSSAKPTKHKTRSATYRLPAGSVTVAINGNTFKTVKPSTMNINFPATRPSSLVLIGTFDVNGVKTIFVGKASLANGSFTNEALRHPTVFAPASQVLAPAAVAPGPGSTFHYSILGGKTKLGLTGSATSS